MSPSNEIFKAISVFEFICAAAHTVQPTSVSVDAHAVLSSNEIFKAINVFDILFTVANIAQSAYDSVDVLSMPSSNEVYKAIDVFGCLFSSAYSVLLADSKLHAFGSLPVLSFTIYFSCSCIHCFRVIKLKQIN